MFILLFSFVLTCNQVRSTRDFFSLCLSAHYIILLVESVLFGVFVMVIFYDQVCARNTRTQAYSASHSALSYVDNGNNNGSTAV